jgi:hypothetical protein
MTEQVKKLIPEDADECLLISCRQCLLRQATCWADADITKLPETKQEILDNLTIIKKIYRCERQFWITA